MKRADKAIKLIPCIFTFVGIVMLVAGIFWCVSTLNFMKTAVKISGRITDIEVYRSTGGEIRHSVYVTYEYNGKQYENVPIPSYSSRMAVGKEISLYCNPDDPWQVQADSGLYVGTGIFLGLGLLFTSIGGGCLIFMTLKSRRKRRIREQGRSIYATVEEIAYNTSFSMNGVHPYIIYCTYRDEYRDVIHRFKSENLWSNPSYVFPVGSTIEVKVDEKDYDQYYVNVEEMDKKVIDHT